VVGRLNFGLIKKYIIKEFKKIKLRFRLRKMRLKDPGYIEK